MTILHRLLLPLLTLCGLLLLSSCGRPSTSDLPNDLSADEYLSLAATADPAKKPLFELAAANQLITQQKSQQARALIENLQPNLTPQQTIDKQLLNAKLALLDGQPQTALSTLQAIESNHATLNSAQQITLHQLFANIYETLGDTQTSLQQRLLLNRLLPDTQAQRLNLIAIWRTLQAQPTDTLKHDANQTTDPILKGWFDLTLITREAATPNALVNGLRRWKAAYPNHIAETLLPSNITDAANGTTQQNFIALLLPLHGHFASAGKAIENGFLAAYYAAEKKQLSMPRLKIFDTSQAPIEIVYQRARQAGANFIIGPLLKDNLERLLNEGDIDTTTLALNTLINAPHRRHLYQFGLSPFDEATQAANKGQQENYKNAVIIASKSSWGQTIADVFRTNWTKQGGQVIAEVNTSNARRLSQQIAQLLNVNEADQSYLQLKRLLGTHTLRYIPRRRRDIDLIYLVEQPAIARQIVPLLKYYFAGNIPVFAVSQVYTHNTTKNRDLDGVMFADIPWTLNTAQTPYLNKLRQQIKTVWPASYASHTKLYALGIDAYLVYTKLTQMKTLPQFGVSGATGELFLDDSQHVYRQLPWAVIKHGKPVLIK